jgi:hypothetical protein
MDGEPDINSSGFLEKGVAAESQGNPSFPVGFY